MESDPFIGWTQVQLMLGEGSPRFRVIVAVFDPAGRPGTVSDLVAAEGGRRQESVHARVELDGRIQGTHWLVEGDRHTPRPLTDREVQGVRVLAQSLWERSSTE
jgi:hypothetical protein